MCGIIGAFNLLGKNKVSVNEWVLNQYEDQYTRGSKGFGIVTVDKKGILKNIFRACEPIKMMFDLHINQSPIILMHHRSPTSTDNKIDQTHPISVSNGSLKYDYLIMHNGIIRNEDDLYKAHTELGFVYTTAYLEVSTTYYRVKKEDGELKFNDSECVAIEIARFMEGQIDTVGVLGSCAFLGLQINKESKKVEKIIFGRKDNPLNLSNSRGEIRLSSEGKGDEIKPYMLYMLDPITANITKRKMAYKEEPATEPTEITKSFEFNGSDRSIYGNTDDGYHYNKDTTQEEIEEENERIEKYSEITDDINQIMEIMYDELNENSALVEFDVDYYLNEFRRILERAKEIKQSSAITLLLDEKEEEKVEDHSCH
ncbi:MAG: hypothetical protein PHU12_03920 [Candidatus Aenigmarchaeota archaeon]|nr:hypothetical protein [Candidatus Aenigmarchaeota archaeon]